LPFVIEPSKLKQVKVGVKSIRYIAKYQILNTKKAKDIDTIQEENKEEIDD